MRPSVLVTFPAAAAALVVSLAGPARAQDPAQPAAAPPPAHVHGGSDSDADAKVPTHQKHPRDTVMPKPTGKDVELKVGDETSRAYVARPHGKTRGALLVIHEYWGLNDHIKATADRFAREGYLALAIDLYKGKVAKTPKEAEGLMGGKDEKWGDTVEEAGLEWLKKAAPGAKVGTIGWCMGGGESLRASLHDPKDVAATVIYYGLPTTEGLDQLKGPVLGIWAKKDGWITPEKVDAFDKALTTAGVKHEFHSYDADHAFANPTGARFNPPAAKDADAKALAFLRKHLG